MRWVLLLVVLLRLPTFFEPYWDGDEGVYYLLGQMIQRGAVLYRDIWDNKTPLLYLIYALHPTLLWAKFSATLFVLGTCLGIYFLAKKMRVSPLGATALAGFLLSFPILEGNTANAELYFTLPIVWGAYLAWQRKWPWILGLLAVVAFNLKVPAIFDFAGIFLAIFIFRREIKFYLPIAAVFLGSLALVFGYFYWQHALGDFWTAAFAQNSTYVSFWSGPLGKLGNPLIVRGVVLLAGLGVLIFLYAKKFLTKEFLFLASWFGFSLYATLLSGRPYPHYILQLVPPLAIFCFYLLANIKRYWFFAVGFIVLGFFLVRSFGTILSLSDKLDYYKNFLNYISERETWEKYQARFGQDNVQAYKMAEFLKENTRPSEPTFVWGENDYMYILSQRPPATKFIRAHHLTTVDPKNYALTVERLKKFQPRYIFIARPVQFPFPKLEEFVRSNYQLVTTFGNWYTYQNIGPVTPQKWTPNY